MQWWWCNFGGWEQNENQKPCFNCIFGKTQIFRSWSHVIYWLRHRLFIPRFRKRFWSELNISLLVYQSPHNFQTVVIIHRNWELSQTFWVSINIKRKNKAMVPNPTSQHIGEPAQLGRRQIRGTLQRYCQKGIAWLKSPYFIESAPFEVFEPHADSGDRGYPRLSRNRVPVANG